MQRRSFLKLLGLATTCAIISNPLELLSKPITKEAKTWYMKVSTELLYSVKDARKLIMNRAKEYVNDPDWEAKTSMEIGFEGDDFPRNLQTIVFRYRP